MKKIPVLITTTGRGVFFGYIDEKDIDKDPIAVKDMQMVVYWSADVKGVFGLCVNGPSNACRVSKPVNNRQLKNIESITDVSKAAEKQWKSCPWQD